METINSFKKDFHKVNDKDFDAIALRLFKIQAIENKTYSKYLKLLGLDANSIETIEAIPFLPVSFFKSHQVKTGDWGEETIFTSSGTTGAITSRHFVKDVSFYLNHSNTIFNAFFGQLQEYHFLALLPSYLEREGSSLVAMANYFIDQSNSAHSGFFLNNYDGLVKKILNLRGDKRKVVLLGVSFALLELAENYQVDLSHCIVMETGGMKGRRKEIIREELHHILCSSFNVTNIASEYGMTELLSQAYSVGNGYYRCPKSMKIQVRDIYDPGQLVENGRVGVIRIIDLANFDSCAFIETQDLGRINFDGSFEVLGRIDNSDTRGCNLLV